MAKSSNAEQKARILRQLAFHIHRKRDAVEVLGEFIEDEGRAGRHRAMREVAETLAESGFVAALQKAGWIGDEAAAVLAAVMDTNDHRAIGGALGRLADFNEFN